MQAQEKMPTYSGGDKINPGDTPQEVPSQQPDEVPPDQTD